MPHEPIGKWGTSSFAAESWGTVRAHLLAPTLQSRPTSRLSIQPWFRGMAIATTWFCGLKVPRKVALPLNSAML